MSKRRNGCPNIKRSLICPGYTEPNAGTDLASLQMRAVPDGDDYIVNDRRCSAVVFITADYHWIFSQNQSYRAKHKGISLLMRI